MMRDAMGKAFTARVIDPKLTGVETGGTVFKEYESREMERGEVLAEGMRYEFF